MTVKVVNMIPNSMSNETGRDSEPNITATFLDPSRIAASAFTLDPMNSGSAPIYISLDGGDTWTLNVVLPGGNKTGDTTLRFVGSSNVLYGGILRTDTGALNILRKADFTTPGLMDVLVSKSNDDQPYIEGATVMGPGAGVDRVYVGENDFAAASGHTATIDFSLDAANTPAPAGFVTNTSIETRTTVGQDGPPIRPAIHLDGTIYGVFMGWRSATTTDVVVVRDDNWASGANRFADLTDGGSAGKRVASAVPRCLFNSLLGTQRVGGQVAIAVDPRDSDTVYIAWTDGTTAANQTIHVRSSTDRGVTWSATDLRTINTATNPCLAINVQGKVGFLYQHLHDPGTGNRWETHLETSSTAFNPTPTGADNLILADVPDSNGSYTGPNPIGDYAGLIAVGKNFYGVFSGNNTPDNANFPNGVTYQRNADFTANTLQDLANAPVAVSIDPFFVKLTTVDADDDFYVRDWTDSASSGDNGAEPSTHAVFFQTSDVWNRRGTLSGAPFPNDQPANEDAGNGTGNIGDNWAFARIRRNAAAASGSQTVTAHFLVSKFGTGSNYVDASSGDPDVTFVDPDPTVTFNAADVGPLITPPCHWHLNAIASTHLCLAVEITGPNDPYIPPSLLGNAPGWPTTDLRIINDNNKAQRNMGLSTTPARGVGGSDCYSAIVHNAASFPRDVELRYEATPEATRALQSGGAVIEVAGSREQPFRGNGTLKFSDMQPGENRWVTLRFPGVKGHQGEIVTVAFLEIVQGVVVNGFAMGARLGSMTQVLLERLQRHWSVFTRVAAAFRAGEAEESAGHARILAERGTIDEASYGAFVVAQLANIDAATKALLSGRSDGDPFRLAAAADQFKRVFSGGNAGEIALSHSCMLSRIDSYVTMQRLENGDVADILQNVRWQAGLYRRNAALAKLPCAATIQNESGRFIQAYGRRRVGNRNYPALLRSAFTCFDETARTLRQPALESSIHAMRNSLDDPTKLQKVHREFLLGLQSHAQSVSDSD